MAWCRQALRTGKRGRPQQTLPTGGTGRRQHPGAHRPRRGPKRPQEQAPSPEPPDPAPSVVTTERPAKPRAAFHTARRRRWAASRRRTNSRHSTPDAAKQGERCTGGCRPLGGGHFQYVKSRQWLEGCWTMAVRAMSSACFKKRHQGRTKAEVHETEPVPGSRAPADMRWRAGAVRHVENGSRLA